MRHVTTIRGEPIVGTVTFADREVVRVRWDYGGYDTYNHWDCRIRPVEPDRLAEWLLS